MKKEGTESICVVCGSNYYVPPSARAKRKTCSRDCFSSLDKTWLKKDLAERFWKKVQKTETCWLWTGAKLKTGYGSIRVHGKALRAHRVAYELVVGKIPHGLLLRHSCDTPLCVNPEHLSPGTKSDNTKDAIDRGQHKFGENDSKSILCKEAVIAIRAALSVGVKGVFLAKQFNVSESHISGIKNGSHRKHG